MYMRAHAQPGWRKLGLAALALLALTLMIAACGTTTSTGTGGSGGTSSPTATMYISGGSGGYGGYTPRATATSTASSAAATAPAGNGAATKIEIAGAGTYSFSPASVTIKAGTKVTWTNNSVAPHTVTSDTGAPAAFDSGTVSASGGTFSFTFTTPGTYTYHCNFHAYMQGTVVVTM
jgi:plastocyanin